MAKAKKGSRFVYPLKSVLKVRMIREDQQKDVFKKALEKLEEEKRKEAEIKKLEQTKYTELKSNIGAGKTLNFQDIQLRKRHLEVLKEKKEAQIKVRMDAETQKESERLELIRKTQDRQIIEKDREKTRIEWREIMKKEENKFLDEIASTRYYRNHMQDEDDTK